MDGDSIDIKQARLQRLKELFPELFAESQLDWEKLKAAFGDDINFANERYVLNWAGKSDAFKILQQPTTTTLKPAPEESVNFNSTENLFIEGENLEVLKVLQKAYYGKVKCIIIDPPYNTGSDSFIYPDKFSEKKEDYLKRIGDKDEEGYLMKEGLFRKNSKDSGHYHSNWLSMMYPRLFLAKNLLRDDGVIFVHIDDNEVHNLRMVMNEIFGEENFVAQFVWRTDGNFDNQAKVKVCHEYINAYCKNLNFFPPPPVIDPSIDSSSKLFKEEIRNTIVKNGPANPVSKLVLPVGFPTDFEKGRIEKRDNAWPRYLNDAIVEDFRITNETTIESGWSSKDLVLEFIKSGLKPIFDGKEQETAFVITRTGALEVIKKRKENHSYVISVLTNLGNTQTTSANLKRENIHFDYPKPVQLEKYLLSMNEGEEFIALDFFGGSGTLAQAVLEINSQKSKFAPKRIKFIVVQLPEHCSAEGLSYKAGCKSIADVAKERIRKVIQKIEKEKLQKPDLFAEGKPDLGFKVFKLSSSSFKIWRGSEIDSEEKLVEQLDAFTNPIKPGAEKQNMLYELMLKTGYELTSAVQYVIASGAKHSQKGKKIASGSTDSHNDSIGFYSINNNELIIALDGMNEELIEQIIAAKPQKVITLDSLFAGNDQLKTNTVLQVRDAGIDFKTI
ncbi:MAG: site-specific DNA-methyltransferase [Nitrospirae bacterium]|nr:site-specific DNA-methyltransferase [Nitrospirota bacterium]MCL5421340.1 site-specific DNA-methyltransferase [Nitrospirota bacterium]